jgi:mRNA-degrading endonuclease RelE of RelBE toxin-antitoxin system
MVGSAYSDYSNVTGYQCDSYAATTIAGTQYTTTSYNNVTIAVTGGTAGSMTETLCFGNYRATHNDWPTAIYGGAVGVAGGCNIVSNNSSYVWPAETDEERTKRLEREKEAAERLKRAERKARKLLLDTIGKEEFRKYKKCGYVEVTGPSGTTYRLKPSDRIVVMGKDGKASHKLCLIYNDPKYPPTDLIIHEYLMILAGQEEFIEKTANRFAA